MGLELKEGQVFKIVELAYRTGLMEKGIPIVGEAMKDAQEKTGFKLPDMVEFMNEATDDSVRKIDTVLKYVGPVMALVGNEKLMKPIFSLGAKLLDLKSVQAISVRALRKVMEITFNIFKKVNAKKLAGLRVS